MIGGARGRAACTLAMASHPCDGLSRSRYAASRGYAVKAVFHHDVSGGGDFMGRPVMVEMLRFLSRHARENYLVIFGDLKRFARDTKFHLILRERLAAYNATLECLNFEFEDTPEDKFIETIIAAQGELERLPGCARRNCQRAVSGPGRGPTVLGVAAGVPEIRHRDSPISARDGLADPPG